jgi:hypothetical protein
MTNAEAYRCALRAVGSDADEFAKHAELTVTLSMHEDDQFVDAFTALLHTLTGLVVRVELDNKLTPMHHGPWPNGPRA